MPIRAITLDVGWTLAHPQRTIWDIFAEICHDAGADVTPEQCEASVGELRRQMREHLEASFHDGATYTDSDEEFAGTFAQMAALVLGRFGVTLPVEEFNHRFLAAFWTEGNWQRFPDVLDALRALRARGIRVGVLSNAPTNLPSFLDRLGIAPHLDFVVVSASEGFRKPDRRIFSVALERAAVAPREALHVGDMYLEDIVGGTAAGVSTLLIERGAQSLFPNFPESHGHPLAPDRVVRDLHDVLRRLDD